MKGTSHDGHRTNGRHVAHTDPTNSASTHLAATFAERANHDGAYATTAHQPRWRLGRAPRRR